MGRQIFSDFLEFKTFNVFILLTKSLCLRILLVYDVSSRKTFESVRAWIKQIQEHADPGVNIILVGNKCDMEVERVSYESKE